jgi:uncharacterized protein YcfL
MPKLSTLLILPSTVALLLLAGCAPTCVTIPSSGFDGSYRVGSGFSGDIGIEPPATRKHNGLTQSKITFYNKTSSNQRFQYKFTWQDKNGFNVGNNTPWQPVQLYPSMTKTVTTIAPNTMADHYDVQVCRLTKQD